MSTESYGLGKATKPLFSSSSSNKGGSSDLLCVCPKCRMLRMSNKPFSEKVN